MPSQNRSPSEVPPPPPLPPPLPPPSLDILRFDSALSKGLDDSGRIGLTWQQLALFNGPHTQFYTKEADDCVYIPLFKFTNMVNGRLSDPDKYVRALSTTLFADLQALAKPDDKTMQADRYHNERLVKFLKKEVRYKNGEREYQGVFEGCVLKGSENLDTWWAVQLRGTGGPWSDVFQIGSLCNGSITIELVN